jgi:proteic killer suppression protein
VAIKSFRNKALEDFFYEGTTQGINAKHANKLGIRLDRLDAATCPNDMRLPGFRLHKLEPKKAERFAVDVSGAWRLTFEFEGEDAIVVDYEQYH